MDIIRQSGDYAYTFSRFNKPIARVKPGEKAVIETTDAYAGILNSENQLPSVILAECSKHKHLNPQTGPVYIEGAEPGDILAVHILDIDLYRGWAVSALFENCGALSATSQTRLLNDPIPEKVWIYKPDGDYYKSKDHLRFPVAPFLGTMATAPEMEVFSSLSPFGQGGNMDCKDVKPGNTVYLPVEVEGAYFYTGDCHVNQGDGEICSTALETAARTTFRFELIKGKNPLRWPRIESPEQYMTVGSMRPLEDAARIACCVMVDWMAELGWDKLDAYEYLSIGNHMYIANLVNTTYTVVSAIDKKDALYYLKNK